MEEAIGYENIGGSCKQLKEIKEIVESQLKQQSFKSQVNTGILLVGSPGVGKTLMARAIANESKASFSLIKGHDLMSKLPDQVEIFLKLTFESAFQNAPSVIFIDEIDIILPKREMSETEKRIKQLTYSLIDKLKKNARVILIAATGRIENIDSDLFKSSRMDRKIEINKPDVHERLAILKIHTKKMKLAKNVDLEKIANETIGFVGADLALLVSEAGLHYIKEKMTLIDLDDSEDDSEANELDLNSLAVDQDAFIFALKNSNPIQSRQKSDTEIEEENRSSSRCESRCASRCGRRSNIKWLNN